MTQTLLKYPNGHLRTRCTTTLDADYTLQKLERALIGPNGDYTGVGLAANQIGLRDRICIIRHPQLTINLVNPVVLAHSGIRQGSVEECLSIPNFKTTVMRWTSVTITADNLDKPLYVTQFKPSCVVQHEIDHLDSILLIDYLPVGRNKLCPCGSGKKFKKCCIEIETALDKRRRLAIEYE